ncbi:hypothetical protein PV11_00488 [Exophiala sideris]|uniref:IgE-binding protein n=1 Tax=Exophiala sideris TaxID=1016849 RepID=A0A0D1YPG0_9EURO|nr:hypothetical protein PV11_00488 [Exophiala sideris]
MQIKTAVIATLPALGALAVPTGSSGNNPDATFPAVYGLIVGEDIQPFHFESINANANKFWINLPPTATSCPYTGTDQASFCPPGNETAFIGSGSLAASVPGGQQIYVDTTGALMYTTAHTHVIPSGAVSYPFTYTLPGGAQYGSVSTRAFGADGFMACPTHGSIAYQVFASFAEAQVPLGNVNDCVPLAPLSIPYTAGNYAAWQYI